VRFLLDESAKFRLAAFLAGRSHDVTAIAHDYPQALTDRDVLSIARREKRIVITNDLDFGMLVFRDSEPPLWGDPLSAAAWSDRGED
jgi:predicted nuclease of predicted toxin-antitoxin system